LPKTPVVEQLGNVFPEIAECTAALRAAHTIRQVNNVFAWQVLRQWLASRRHASFGGKPDE
jgi:hypothetical protein